MTQQDWDGLLDDQKQFFDNCKTNPNEDGSYPILKKYITILFVTVLIFLSGITLLLALLVWAACTIIKKGPKKDKWAKKYNGGSETTVKQTTTRSKR